MTDDIAKNCSRCLGCDFAIFNDGNVFENFASQLGINGDWTIPAEAPSFDSKGVARSSGRRGCWLLSSKSRVATKDVNEHLRFLLGVLLPHREVIIKAATGGDTVFTVHWSGQAYPYASGPALAVDCVAGIAKLNAELVFTVHQTQ
ncbi:hypothetical protein Plim_4059 [Planctopirus limnophila DSM 3776]|uniref:Uncharacterized protein n=1 Tax=Planctopirus limnophila (strain ATCC 43296 / DSM 3776 / IFAM 1008 / Mu 290) TaxID=521674 RepID=D5SY77_PLAL2|nr:hypothetical protein [Planctopirus limnophila]ADG69870.1 hypothetical protein Plim_4059 [Planctopirus limnophila DSM 3776]